MRGAGAAAGDLLPAAPAPARPAAAPALAPGAPRRGAGRRARRAPRAALRGPRAGGGLRHAARRRAATSAPSARCTASWRRTQEVRERRNQLRHPRYAAPELLARRPNELWSWDITKLLGPAKWTYFYLYVMLDVFSRYVVGWMVAHRESADAGRASSSSETCARQGIGREQLTIHADRGRR